MWFNYDFDFFDDDFEEDEVGFDFFRFLFFIWMILWNYVDGSFSFVELIVEDI